MAGIPGLGILEAGVGAAQALTGLIGMGKKKRAAQAAVDAIGTYKASQEIGGVYEGAKMRASKGLGGAARQLATQGIEAGAQSAMGAAGDRKAGLGMIGSIQAQKQKGALQLAGQEEAAMQRNQAGLTQAAGMQAAEKTKEFKSVQEKQQLQANIAMQEVAAKRAAISQGLGGIAGGLTAGAIGGEKNPLSGLFGKGLGTIKGMFGKSLGRQSDALQASTRQLLKRGAPQVDSYIEAPTQ